MHGAKRIRSKIEMNNQLLDNMLAHMIIVFDDLAETDSSGGISELYGEKDSLLSAHIKLSNLQMKWVELELSIEKEVARQREVKAKFSNKSSGLSNVDGYSHDNQNISNQAMDLLTDDEWDIIVRAVESRNKKNWKSNQLLEEVSDTNIA